MTFCYLSASRPARAVCNHSDDGLCHASLGQWRFHTVVVPKASAPSFVGNSCRKASEKKEQISQRDALDMLFCFLACPISESLGLTLLVPVLCKLAWFCPQPRYQGRSGPMRQGLADQHGKTLTANAEGDPKVQFVVKPINVRSVTMSEFFFRCSAEFRQIEYGGKQDKDSIRLWFGQAWNQDEAYDMLESLSLLRCHGNRGRSAAVNPHASTLNTLIQRGKTKRTTRTSTTYEGNRSQHISLSILASAHTSKTIAMERGPQGQHTAATKERFLLCVDVSVARHDALPQSMLDADPGLPKWTWLPLTPLQAAIFGWTDIVGSPGHFKDTVGSADEEAGEASL